MYMCTCIFPSGCLTRQWAWLNYWVGHSDAAQVHRTSHGCWLQCSFCMPLCSSNPVVCRGLLVNVTFSMGKRCCVHIGRKAEDPVGWSQAVRILHSGCLSQFLIHWTQWQTPGGLWRDTTTGSAGLPVGMKQAYFENVVQKYGKLGWYNGRFVL